MKLDRFVCYGAVKIDFEMVNVNDRRVAWFPLVDADDGCDIVALPLKSAGVKEVCVASVHRSFLHYDQAISKVLNRGSEMHFVNPANHSLSSFH
ncbi:hypothetical protein [Pseudomonas sp. UFMG81]|uniref:hypothetical protein n=1 Tax=Pseudomonas sp. UFMG81 TaxID=2745936 RepID=UPI003A5C3D27